MLRYHLWHMMLNKVYSAEYWIAWAVKGTEAKFFKAQIDYHEKYDDWNNVLEYIQNDEEDDLEEDDE